MARAYLLVCALVYLFLGLWAIVSPRGMVSLIGVQGTTPDGIADIRAMYGGLQLAYAAVLGWHLMEPGRVRTGLFIAAAGVGGLGLSRVLSAAIDGAGWLTAALAGVELASAAGAVWFAREPAGSEP